MADEGKGQAMARRLVVGNWKMHGTRADLGQVTHISIEAETLHKTRVGLCVPATLINRAVGAAPGFMVGAQDVHAEAKGAFTGSVSAQMIKDAGATMVIVGHSERRTAYGESDADVRAKAEAAVNAGLQVIVCVGEDEAVRGTGQALKHVAAQLEASLPDLVTAPLHVSVAYEPIWAIGTGKAAKPADISAMHNRLRQSLEAAYGDGHQSVRLLYGGSVNGANAAEIFATEGVDGALVGGASLTAQDFLPIMKAAENA